MPVIVEIIPFKIFQTIGHIPPPGAAHTSAVSEGGHPKSKETTYIYEQYP